MLQAQLKWDVFLVKPSLRLFVDVETRHVQRQSVARSRIRCDDRRQALTSLDRPISRIQQHLARLERYAYVGNE